MSKAEFLAKIRQAAQSGQAFRVKLPSFDHPVHRVGARCEDLCEAMAAEVDEVGGQSHRVADDSAAAELLAELLSQYNAQQVLCWQHDLLERIGLGEILQRQQAEQIDFDTLDQLSADQQRKQVLQCDVGITSTDLAIAETGTLLVCSGPGQERMASLVAPVHIAVIERAQIVPDLLDAFDQLQEVFDGELPSNMTLITGPSKTGDIELTLTTGVHGPGQWHVLIIG